MAWRKIIENGITIWECSKYSDLKSNEVDNLARYGQPNNPYLKGFDHDHIPDYENIIVRMSQSEVMTNGYGKLIRPEHFPIIKKLTKSPISLNVSGKYSFNDLVLKKMAKKSDRFIYSNLYLGSNNTPVVSGAGVSSGDAAYIHGSVGFALMSNTYFMFRDGSLLISAEIGALDDNWDFQSDSRIAKLLNPLVSVLYGPEVNNLEPNKSKGSSSGKIFIQYRGAGKRMSTGGIRVPNFGGPRGFAKSKISRGKLNI